MSTAYNHDQQVPKDEFANTLTHALGILIAVIGAALYIRYEWRHDIAIRLSFVAYMASVIGVFVFSTLSHAVKRQPLRDRMRAWDQGMIYTMIAGTYTPFVVGYAGEWTVPLLWFLWISAAIGFYSKVIAKHRVNSLATVTYLVMGWIPAVPLSVSVPTNCLLIMLMGGVAYSIGVLFLLNDHRGRYFHSVWHILVIIAAGMHYLGICTFVLDVA